MVTPDQSIARESLINKNTLNININQIETYSNMKKNFKSKEFNRNGLKDIIRFCLYGVKGWGSCIMEC